MKLIKHRNFETERLVIQPTTLEDKDFILNIVNSPKWLQYIGDRKVRTLADAEKYIKERMISQLERLGYSNYTIIRKSDNSKVGVCGLYDRSGVEGIDIGFALLPEFENKGYAFEAANRLKMAAINEFNLQTINAVTTKDNYASQKLLDKMNFKFNAFIQLPNDDEEIMLYRYMAK